ncbi:MAG: helicase-exonuclease AddAB subunit AddA [Clostridiales bacterium]|nr:helicase-exonuclease AddAB subunit AddA [Clostridiales bacterium]MDU3240318.1 helicase-exonuclease AddAB subunit AddA [Clostridiales bacterium]
MGVAWTEDQQKVIDLRNRNILVSAAAGSGKTAVLVERIVTMVTDKKHPVDIDELLIVTFTKAAAGEMRERIAKALDSKAAENPLDVHLERQLTLVHNAQITTIDSFCQYVIRNHFHAIGLDPGFRVADEGELKLLKSDVAEQLIEDCYEKKDEAFLKFIECYAFGKNDRGIEDLIFGLYNFSMSYPWPEKWLQQCKKAYEIESLEEFLQSEWLMKLTENLRRQLEDIEEKTEEALRIARSEDGPYMYEDALCQDQAMIRQIRQADNYRDYAQAFAEMGKYARLSSKKDEAVSENKKEQVKAIREQVKKSLKGLQEQYFFGSLESVISDIQGSREVMGVLIDLACEFTERYAGKKREKNVVDFSDLEHFALDILVEEKDGEAVPTQIAMDLAEHYEEILIDEYQDSNLVQELILTSISKKCMGKYNIFMVGDVKQSIYRFRLARPELFMEKYDTYPVTDSQCQRIDLHKNFRSRSQVLVSVNYIFEQIMARYLGNIQYDAEAALYPGAAFPEKQADGEGFTNTEMLLVDLDTLDEVVEDVEENARELEARAIGSRILEIVGKEDVLDKATGTYRKARYGDIVILLRTISGWAESFARVLESQGIPAYTGSQSGYFSTVEIQTILAFLKIVDNPRQEIPMAAVLKSPIGGLETQELAVIKSLNPNMPFYECCRLYASQPDEGDACQKGIIEKLKKFFRMLDHFRMLVPYTPMHELLWQVLDSTGYGDYAAAMPGGEQRTANLKMLVEKAMTYETTSYRGLFNFIRYIENLQKYNVDYGEASTIGEQEDTVRIMSIHKSKGLEFPIVFAGGMGKSFNQQDSRSRVLLHPDLGIGCDYIDPVLRVKSPTLLKKTIQRETINENLGEELRVLYVAFTRAKEKLIMTGAVTKIADKIKKWSQICRREEEKISFTELSGASSYLDWVMPALMRHQSARKLLEEYGFVNDPAHELYRKEAYFSIRVCPVKELVTREAAHQMAIKVSKEELLERGQRMLSEQQLEALDKRMDPVYPYEQDGDIHGKITVSELKKYSQSADNLLYGEEEFFIYEEPDIVPLIPRFMQQKTEVPGAVRGTAYHKLLEELNFADAAGSQKLNAQIERLLEAGKMTREEIDLIDKRKIVRLSGSVLGKRMAKAEQEGNLYREQQFVLGVMASEIKESWSNEEMVLIQGIIDAFFYEDEAIILVDYKTDYVPEDHAEILVDKYKIQLDYYAQALERMTQKKVKEKILYSFWLQKGIRIK